MTKTRFETFQAKPFKAGDSIVVALPVRIVKLLKIRLGNEYLFEIKSTELNS